jgi:hypothetical protein
MLIRSPDSADWYVPHLRLRDVARHPGDFVALADVAPQHGPDLV